MAKYFVTIYLNIYEPIVKLTQQNVQALKRYTDTGIVKGDPVYNANAKDSNFINMASIQKYVQGYSIERQLTASNLTYIRTKFLNFRITELCQVSCDSR